MADDMNERTDEVDGVEDEPPITELSRLPDETDDDFVDRVRRVVRRRMIGSHIIDICVVGTALVLLQLLCLVGQLARSERKTEGDD